MQCSTKDYANFYRAQQQQQEVNLKQDSDPTCLLSLVVCFATSYQETEHKN